MHQLLSGSNDRIAIVLNHFHDDSADITIQYALELCITLIGIVCHLINRVAFAQQDVRFQDALDDQLIDTHSLLHRMEAYLGSDSYQLVFVECLSVNLLPLFAHNCLFFLIGDDFLVPSLCQLWII